MPSSNPTNKLNPLTNFVDPSVSTDMSTDGLYVDGVYALTGIVDRLPQTAPNYFHPTFGKIHPPRGINLTQTQPPVGTSWTSPSAELGTEGFIEIIFTLASESTINTFQFDLLNVPCNWSLYYQDPTVTNSPFLQCTDTSGNFIGGSIPGDFSLFLQLTNQSSPNTTTNHYTTLNLSLMQVHTGSLMLQLDRDVKKPFPTASPSQLLHRPYPLGIQNVSAGVSIGTSPVPTPTTPNPTPTPTPAPPPVVGSPPVVTRQPILGFTESYSVSTEPWSNCLTQTSGLYWKSNPQPTADCVVYGFLDVRDENENPQLIDRLYLDPLYTGVEMNVYTTTDTTIAPVFYGSPDILNFTQITSAVPGEGPGWLFSNNNVSLEIVQGWTIGLVWTPSVNVPALLAPDLVFMDMIGVDGSSLNLNYVNGAIVLYQKIGSSITTLNTYTINWGTTVPQPQYVVVSWDPTLQTYQLYVSTVDPLTNQITTNNGVDNSLTVTNPYSAVLSTFNIGDNVAGTATVRGFVNYVWIRQDPFQESVQTAFISSPDTFFDSQGPPSPIQGNYKSLLLAKLNPNQSLGIGWGYCGPGPGYMSAKVWTPVQRNFSLQKGYLELPPQLASWIKLEFTQLQSETYQLPVDSVVRSVELFPPSVQTFYQNKEIQIQDVPTTGYQNLNVSGTAPTRYYTAIPSTTMFGISNIQGGSGYNWPQLYALNASQLGASSWIYPGQVSQVIEPTSSVNLIQETPNGTQYSTDNATTNQFLPRSFPITSVHNYTQAQVIQTWNQAYFVGLNYVAVYKENPVVQFDTVEYLESCTSQGTGTILNNSLTTMEFTSGVGYSSTSPGQSITTQNLQSFSNVQRVQLAGVTSTWNSLQTTEQVLLTDLTSLQLENSVINPTPALSFGLVNQTREILPSIITNFGTPFPFPAGAEPGSYPPDNSRLGFYWPLSDPSNVALIASDEWKGPVEEEENLFLQGVVTGSGVVALGTTGFYTQESETCLSLSGNNSNTAYLYSPPVLNNVPIPLGTNFSFITSLLTGSFFVAFKTTTEGWVMGFGDVVYSSFILQPATHFDFSIYIDSMGGLNFAVRNTVTNSYVRVSDDTHNYSDNGVYRVVASWDNSDSMNLKLNLYVNGKLTNSTSVTGKIDQSHVWMVQLGYGVLTGFPNPPLNDQITGFLSEVAYIQPVATLEQVQTDYQLPPPPVGGVTGAIVPFGSYGVTTVAASTEDNLLTPNDANLLFGIGGWHSVSNCTVTRVASHGTGGSGFSLQVHTTTGGTDAVAGLETGTSAYPLDQAIDTWNPDIGGYPLGAESIGGDLPGFAESDQYTWMVSVLGTTTPLRTYELFVLYYDVLGSLVTSTNPVSTTTEIVNTYVQLIATVSPPATAVYTSIQVHIVGASTGESHFIAEAGLFKGVVTEWVAPSSYVNMRASAVARIYLPDTALGTYKVSLKSNGQIVATTQITPALQTWTDIEVPYLVQVGDSGLQAEIVQTGPYEENFYLNMLGVFVHPIQWEVSSNNGSTWRTVEKVINDPWGFVTFQAPSTEIMVRLTSLVESASITGFMIRPIYLQSPFSYQVSVNYLPSPKSGEQESKRPPKDKSFFKLWDHLYPEFLSLPSLQIQ